MTFLDPFISGSKAPGLWSYSPEDLLAAGSTPSAVRIVQLNQVATKQNLFDALRTHLKLPEWFGENWDALADWSTEPDWLAEAAPTVLVFTGVEAAPEPMMSVCTEILESACQYWAGHGRIVYVLGDVANSTTLASGAFSESRIYKGC